MPSCVRGPIDIALSAALFVRPDDPHVRNLVEIHLRKQHVPRIAPDESGGIAQPPLRLATGGGNEPGVPAEAAVNGCIGDPRAVRRKHRTHFLQAVVRQLDRLPIGQCLDVDLTGAEERLRAANKRDLAAVRGKRGLADGVGQFGDLDPLGEVGATQPSRATRPTRRSPPPRARLPQWHRLARGSTRAVHARAFSARPRCSAGAWPGPCRDTAAAVHGSWPALRRAKPSSPARISGPLRSCRRPPRPETRVSR